MSNVKRGLCAAATAIGLSVILSGCIPNSAISATIRDSHVVFGVCESMADIDTILVSALDKDSHVVTDLWEVSGDLSFDIGSEIVFGEEFAGADVVIGPLPITKSNQYLYIRLTGSGSQGQPTSFYAQFDGDRLTSGEWNRNNGSVGDTAC